MDLKEIIKKNNLTEQEMVFVVQEYLKEKGKGDVEINMVKGLRNDDPLASILYQQRLEMLNSAYDTALGYFTWKYEIRSEENN